VCVCVCLQLLIEAKAGIEVRDKKDGITPLIGTFFHNHIDTARFLIEAGADIMMRRNDENGITPLVNAVALQRTEMANLICEKGALDINLSLHHYDVAGSIANVAASRRWCAGVQPKKTRTRLERSKRREEAIVHRRTRSACSCCMEFTFCIIRLPRYAARHCERASERERSRVDAYTNSHMDPLIVIVNVLHSKSNPKELSFSTAPRRRCHPAPRRASLS